MDWKIFATVFGTVFLAELGDKTQLATVLFASKNSVSLWTIFVAASVALVLTSAIGVHALFGPQGSVPPKANAGKRATAGAMK